MHLRAIFDSRQRRFGGVRMPQAVAEVAADGDDCGGQQGEHTPPAADAEVQPATFGFKINDKVADGGKGCLGVTQETRDRVGSCLGGKGVWGE